YRAKRRFEVALRIGGAGASAPCYMSVRTHEHRTVGFYAVCRYPLLLGIADVCARANRKNTERDAEGCTDRTSRVPPRLAPLARKDREAEVDQVVCGRPVAVMLQPDVRSAAPRTRAGDVVRHGIGDHR